MKTLHLCDALDAEEEVESLDNVSLESRALLVEFRLVIFDVLIADSQVGSVFMHAVAEGL